MIQQTLRWVALATLPLVVSLPAHAATISDPAGDFLATFTGTHSGDLDVLSTSATFDGTTFHLGATVNGNVGTLPTALYVFGFNRGAGSNDFTSLGLPNIKFDTVITMTGAGVTGGRDLVANTPITLPAGAAHISGSSFTLDVPLSLLPSLGLQPLQYGINLWPRDSSVAAGNAQISDFAPNTTTFNATAVPEPSTVVLSLAGLAALFVRRRRS